MELNVPLFSHIQTSNLRHFAQLVICSQVLAFALAMLGQEDDSIILPPLMKARK